MNDASPPPTAAESAGSEVRLRLMLESISDHFVQYDRQWRYTFVTEKGARMVGKTPAELLGQCIWDLFPDAVGNPYHQALNRAVATGEVVRMEHYYAPFGKWYDNHIYPHADGVTVFSIDITERRATEAALRELEQRHHTLLELMPAAMYWSDADGRLRYYNRRAAELWGRAPDLAAGDTRYCGSLRMYAPDGQALAHAQCPFAEVLRTGVPVHNQEVMIERPDGSRITAMVNIEPLRDPAGAIVGAINLFQDISERKASDRALRDSEARYRSLVDASGAIVFVSDANAAWHTPQPAWEAYTGQSFDEYRGHGWAAAIHPDDRDRIVASVLQAVAEARVWRGEARVWHAATLGYRWQEARAVPIRDASGHVREWVGTCIDVHARKAAEEAVLEADRRKDEFLAVLAHELRNPLAPIASSLDILRIPHADHPAALDVMERQVHHLVRLVDDLMEVSRITRGVVELRQESLTLQDVVRAAVEISRPLIAAHGHELDVRLPEEGLPVRGDRVRLTQVVANLLNNAARYTRRGGRIRVLAARHLDEGLICVADNGQGIAPEMQKRIFDMFARGDAAAGGLGIGLGLSRRLTELHGGSIEVASEGEGRGSEFTVRLPLAPESTAAVSPPPRAPRATQPLRVLVVDDNVDAADSLASLLSALGHDTRTANDGRGALRAAEEARPDVILLDLGMPQPDGYAVAREIRQRDWGRSVRLVAVSGWGQDAERRRSRESGFDVHLVKPVSLEQVHDVLAH
jgi:PAS domain S-box-containing protein